MILHKHPLIQYSKLSYENVSPYHKGKGRKCRVWYLEYQHNHFWGDLLRDIIIVLTFTGRRVFYWLKKEYRKEFLFGFILLFALIPAPKRVQAQTVSVSVPAYLKPIPKLTGATPEAFSVPDEVQPILPPPTPVAAPVVVSAPVNNAPSGCGDNFYANYIYMHESGCRTDAIGPNGPCGLGQALPCSKMGCSLSDYACQNQFFTNYAMQRYGSWEAAYNYWLANHNW